MIAILGLVWSLMLWIMDKQADKNIEHDMGML